MSGAVVLGVDVATAHVRVVAIDTTDGTPLASADADLPVPVDTSDGGRAQDPAHAAVALAALARVTTALGRSAGAVRALSVTETSGTVIPCDDAGAAVGPALLYNDRRARAEEARLRAAGMGERPVAALARMGWLQRWSPAARYASAADVVLAALAGGPVPGDTSHHLKAGIDPITRTWPAEVGLLDLPPRALPRLVGPGEVLGAVAAGVARGLGLPSEVQIGRAHV